MIPKRKLDTMRRMRAEFLRVLDLAERGDAEAADQVAVLGGVLVGFVLPLVDEVERLSRREPERTVVPKWDIRGGVA